MISPLHYVIVVVDGRQSAIPRDFFCRRCSSFL